MGHFEQYAHTVGSIVHTQDGAVMFRLVGILVGIRTAVPMGTEQYTPFAFRIIGADNIARFQGWCCQSHQVGMLVGILWRRILPASWQGILRRLCGRRCWYARTKIRLGLYVLACTVCTELGHLDSRLVASPSLSLSAADLLLLLLHATIATISNSSNGMNV